MTSPTTNPIVVGKPTFADRDIVVYDAGCPECEHPLKWAVETPPIPLTFFSWFDADCEKRLEFCPACDAELPQGDLERVV